MYFRVFHHLLIKYICSEIKRWFSFLFQKLLFLFIYLQIILGTPIRVNNLFFIRKIVFMVINHSNTKLVFYIFHINANNFHIKSSPMILMKDEKVIKMNDKWLVGQVSWHIHFCGLSNAKFILCK